MKYLYIECNMGIAGDMFNAALLDIVDQPQDILSKLNFLGLEGVEVKLERKSTQGIYGNYFRVIIQGEEEESLDVDNKMDGQDGEEGHSHAHGHQHNHHEHRHQHGHHHGDHDHSHDHSHHHDHDHHHGHHHDHHDQSTMNIVTIMVTTIITTTWA